MKRVVMAFEPLAWRAILLLAAIQEWVLARAEDMPDRGRAQRAVVVLSTGICGGASVWLAEAFGMTVVVNWRGAGIVPDGVPDEQALEVPTC